MGTEVRGSATVTRPNNTTPYTAGDVVGGVITFPIFGSTGHALAILSTQFRWDVSAIPSGATSFVMHLYNETPPSAYADNAAWDLPSGDRAYYQGFINLGTPVDLGSTCYVEQNIINKEIVLQTQALYAYCVTTTGYTPSAQAVQFFRLLGLGLW